MAQSFHFREQAERCRRLARDSTDPVLRDNLLGLAEEYAAQADAEKNGSDNADTAVRETILDEDDQGAA
jgi:hypothetical protein